MDTDRVFNENKNNIFMNNLSSTLSVKKDIEIHDYNYEWIDIIENTIPYIDNILRNPKRFIINEEDIVRVELSKKITVESVIHLAQNTNLIQDYDLKTGDVKPSKVLNIFKEDSLDTYENRFIFTLINNLRLFIEKRLAIINYKSTYRENKSLKYEGNSKVSGEIVNFKLEVISNLGNEKEVVSESKVSLEERIKNIKLQLDNFMSSELVQTLTMLHVPLVKAPIKKTNVILKNPNFQKAEELWNYIQMYESSDINEIKKEDYFDNGNLKGKFDEAILMAYIASTSLNQDGGKLSDEETLAQIVDRLIENLLDSDHSIDENYLKNLFFDEIKKVKEENDKKKKDIIRIFKMKLNNELDKLNRSFDLLDRGV